MNRLKCDSKLCQFLNFDVSNSQKWMCTTRRFIIELPQKMGQLFWKEQMNSATCRPSFAVYQQEVGIHGISNFAKFCLWWRHTFLNVYTERLKTTTAIVERCYMLSTTLCYVFKNFLFLATFLAWKISLDSMLMSLWKGWVESGIRTRKNNSSRSYNSINFHHLHLFWKNIYVGFWPSYNGGCKGLSVIDPVRTKNRKRSVLLHQTIRDDDF